MIAMDIIQSPSDFDVLEEAASDIATPRASEGDSFVIHAPLEVMARARLLGVASPARRGEIRAAINAVADRYQAWGTAVPRRVQRVAFATKDAPRRLADAVADADLDHVDDAVTALAARLGTDEFVAALAPVVLPSLSAAAHGPILLHLLSTAGHGSPRVAEMARPTMRDLARHPEQRLTWIDRLAVESSPPDPADQAELGAALTDRLVAPRLAQQPDSHFIEPTMSAVDRSGLAASTLADLAPRLTVATARRHLLTVAAHSMLQDEDEHAPYGWSHCLTMPQAALSTARAAHHPSQAIAVAATYVLGFRATLSSAPLEPHLVPEPVSLSPEEMLAASPAEAAAAAWHASADRGRVAWLILATNAATHPDAHLAKYTLACLDAARADPADEPLHRAAAAYLNAWWAGRSS